MEPSDLSMAIWMAGQMQSSSQPMLPIPEPQAEPKVTKAEKPPKTRPVCLWFGMTFQEIQAVMNARQKIPFTDNGAPLNLTPSQREEIASARQTIERLLGKTPPEETLEEWVNMNVELAAKLVSEPLQANLPKWNQLVRLYIKEVPVEDHDPREYAQRRITLLLKRICRNLPKPPQIDQQVSAPGPRMSSHEVAQMLLTKPDLPLLCYGLDQLVGVKEVPIAAARDANGNRSPYAILKIAK